ncbi:hypothetical protein HDK64DRAFT_265397 [Phyllosticta capitalensis]
MERQRTPFWMFWAGRMAHGCLLAAAVRCTSSDGGHGGLRRAPAASSHPFGDSRSNRGQQGLRFKRFAARNGGLGHSLPIHTRCGSEDRHAHGSMPCVRR